MTFLAAQPIPTHPYDSRLTIRLYSQGYVQRPEGYTDPDTEDAASDSRCPHCCAPAWTLEYLYLPGTDSAKTVATCGVCFGQSEW